MKKIILYLLGWLFLLVLGSLIEFFIKMPKWYLENIIFFKCAYIGGLGGILYCLRGIYLNRCVWKKWNTDWEIWYYLRPIVSVIAGFISCIFLYAGLLILNATSQSNNISYGYLAIAFIAGYNVDNFMKKLENIADEVWNIKKSRIANDE